MVPTDPTPLPTVNNPQNEPDLATASRARKPAKPAHNALREPFLPTSPKCLVIRKWQPLSPLDPKSRMALPQHLPSCSAPLPLHPPPRRPLAKLPQPKLPMAKNNPKKTQFHNKLRKKMPKNFPPARRAHLR